MLNCFLYAKSVDEEYQFRLSIEDTARDSHLAVDIVDMAEGIGAEYLQLKGCTRTDKLAKVMRFCAIKSTVHNQQ